MNYDLFETLLTSLQIEVEPGHEQVTKRCQWCTRPFQTTFVQTQFCSSTCHVAAKTQFELNL